MLDREKRRRKRPLQQKEEEEDAHKHSWFHMNVFFEAEKVNRDYVLNITFGGGQASKLLLPDDTDRR